MIDNEKKELEEIMKKTANAAAHEVALGYRFMYEANETRFHFIHAALIVLGVLVGFLLAKALL